MLMSLSPWARAAATAVLGIASVACTSQPTASTAPASPTTAPHPMMGVWQFEGYEGLEPRWLVIDAQGQYAHAEVGNHDGAGHTGIEAGQLPLPAANRTLPPQVHMDTNGQWGLSHPQAAQWLWSVDDDGHTAQLRVRTPDPLLPERLLRRLDTPHARDNAQGTPVGAWQHPDGHVLIISSKRTWVWMDNTHASATTPRASAPANCKPQAGLEYGSYVLQGHALRVGLVFADTNGCGGLHNASAATQVTWQLQLQGDTLQMQGPGQAPLVLQRL